MLSTREPDRTDRAERDGLDSCTDKSRLRNSVTAQLAPAVNVLFRHSLSQRGARTLQVDDKRLARGGTSRPRPGIAATTANTNTIRLRPENHSAVHFYSNQ